MEYFLFLLRKLTYSIGLYWRARVATGCRSVLPVRPSVQIAALLSCFTWLSDFLQLTSSVLSINESINESINQPTKRPTDRPTDQYQSINQHVSIYLSSSHLTPVGVFGASILAPSALGVPVLLHFRNLAKLIDLISLSVCIRHAE